MNRFIAIAVAVIVLAAMTLVGRQVSAADDEKRLQHSTPSTRLP